MNEELFNELQKLLACFPRSYINQNLEVILIPKTNTYFSLEGVSLRRDIIAKLFMWCSRTIANREVTKAALNTYLETFFSDEDINLIYQRLGNGINQELTYIFIDSGFDMEVLYD